MKEIDNIKVILQYLIDVRFRSYTEAEWLVVAQACKELGIKIRD